MMVCGVLGAVVVLIELWRCVFECDTVEMTAEFIDLDELNRLLAELDSYSGEFIFMVLIEIKLI